MSRGLVSPFIRGIVVGVGLYAMVIMRYDHIPFAQREGGEKRRLATLDDAYSTENALSRKCIQGTSFRSMRRMDARLVHGASGIEDWALRNWTGAESIVFSHGTPRKGQEPVPPPSFENDCSEFDLANVESDCVLLTQTNSKALPYHVVRYKRNDDRWELRSRVDGLRLPLDADIDYYRSLVLALATGPVQGTTKQELLRKVMSAATVLTGNGPKRGKFSQRRLRGEGAVLLSICTHQNQVKMILNLACSLAKSQKKLIVAVAHTSLETQLREVHGLVLLYHPAFQASVHKEFAAAWLLSASLYLINSMGFDLLFMQPNAVWRHEALTPLLEGKRYEHADAIFATMNTHAKVKNSFSAMPSTFFLRSNWKTELFLDAFIHSQDVASSFGFAATLQQHLSEAHSLFGLEVQRFDPNKHVYIYPSSFPSQVQQRRALASTSIFRRKKKHSDGNVGASLRKFSQNPALTTQEEDFEVPRERPSSALSLDSSIDADILVSETNDAPPPLWLLSTKCQESSHNFADTQQACLEECYASSLAP